MGRLDLAARLEAGSIAQATPLGRLVAAAQRLRGRFRTHRRGTVDLPAHEIAERLLKEEWTKHIDDIALLCPGLPERIHDTITTMTGLNTPGR